jgi:hypothetical protein
MHLKMYLNQIPSNVFEIGEGGYLGEVGGGNVKRWKGMGWDCLRDEGRVGEGHLPPASDNGLGVPFCAVKTK